MFSISKPQSIYSHFITSLFIMAKLLNFSEASSIGIHGMILIAQSGKKTSINQVAETIGASKHHTAKILQMLVQERLLKSLRGPSGGFVLAKPADQISLYDIYKCIEGEVETDECPSISNFCLADKCIIGTLGLDLLKELKNRMVAQTLDQFIGKEVLTEKL